MSDSYEFLKAQKDSILAERKKEHDAPFLERIAQLERELAPERQRREKLLSFIRSDPNIIRLRDTRNRLLERVASLEAQLAESRNVIVNIHESRNACGCWQVCHCNDNVSSLLSWKNATLEAVAEYIARDAKKGTNV